MAYHRKTYRSNGNRNPKFSNIAYIIAATISVLVIGSLFFLQAKTETEMAVDQKTLCPKETGPTAMAIILFDLTDPLSFTQRNQLSQYIDAEIQSAAIGTLWSLGVVSDKPELWGARDPICKPRSGKDVSSLTQNVRMVEERYEAKFLNPVKEEMAKMMAASSAKQSPIMEALQALLSDTPHFLSFQGQKKIIIVSDLLQNSEAMSFYRGDDWLKFRSSPNFELLSQSLWGSDVQLFTIPRGLDGPSDPAVVEDFWFRYFDHQGAKSLDARKLGDL